MPIPSDKYIKIMHIYTRAEHPHLSWVFFYLATTPPSIIDYRDDSE